MGSADDQHHNTAPIGGPAERPPHPAASEGAAQPVRCPAWPWLRYRVHTAAEREAGIHAAEVLKRWRTWPAAAGGLRIGIAAEVTAPMDPAGDYLASLAWVLVSAGFGSGRDAGDEAGPYYYGAVVADDHSHDPDPEPGDDPGHPGDGRWRDIARRRAHGLDPAVPVAASLPDAVDQVTHALALDDPTTAVRLLVLITRSRTTPHLRERAVRLQRFGCAVLALRIIQGEDRWQPGNRGRVVGELAPGTVTQPLDPHRPIPGPAIGQAAMHALHRADPTRLR